MARQRWLLGATLAAACLQAACAEEEEVSATPVESAISVMLLGSIGFQMLLFYLVHWEDTDIKRYAWRVISQTISIFCAVLIFQGFNGLLETYLAKGGSELWEVMVDMGQLVCWLTGMQIALAITSGALNDLWGGEKPDMEKVELNVASWAVLFSHVAGFSAINAWGSIQQKLLNGSPTLAALVVPVGYLSLHIMYQGYDKIRTLISKSDDGIVDEYEDKWDEETEECENDVAGLSLSFLTVQAIRFAISGILPNQEGIESPSTEYSHGGSQWQMLIACGFFFGFLGVSMLHVDRFIREPSERTERTIKILNNYFTFGNAWCFFYGVKWALCSTRFTTETALLHVVIALSLSGMAFLLIFVLDKVMDNELLGSDSSSAENAMEKIIVGLGILVGFSWEQSFDTAVTVISVSLEKRFPQVVSKLLMSIVLVIIVFPAWRRYILPIERDLAGDTSEEGLKKAVLKEAAGQHYSLMICHETDEAALDLAHLRMKEHRRKAIGHSHHVRDGLKHLQVSTRGIIEVEKCEEPNEKKKTTHRKTQEVINLLG